MTTLATRWKRHTFVRPSIHEHTTDPTHLARCSPEAVLMHYQLFPAGIHACVRMWACEHACEQVCTYAYLACAYAGMHACINAYTYHACQMQLSGRLRHHYRFRALNLGSASPCAATYKHFCFDRRQCSRRPYLSWGCCW